jgi:acyl-CoA thioesterase I
MLLQSEDHVVFIGDSITDGGWEASASGLGSGYVAMVAGRLFRDYPEMQFTVTNRGVSGNKLGDLVGRAKADVIGADPPPTVVSILIGINDVWSVFEEDGGESTPPAKFYEDYTRLCRKIVDKLDARLVILEPFCLPVEPVTADWRTELDPKIQVVRQIAADFAAPLVPLDGVFAAACSTALPEYWTEDGVHPSLAGHQLIADSWLEAVRRAAAPATK